MTSSPMRRSTPSITARRRICSPWTEWPRRSSFGASTRRHWLSLRGNAMMDIHIEKGIMYLSDDFRVKVGLAEMLKGGVIMDVTNVEQAKIAESAGASAVMALERVPSDIRKEGGVARMANIAIIEKIMQTVDIPVMAKARIGHFM